MFSASPKNYMLLVASKEEYESNSAIIKEANIKGVSVHCISRKNSQDIIQNMEHLKNADQGKMHCDENI